MEFLCWVQRVRCLVNAINAREFCKRLEADLAAGRNEQECRGMVKAVLRGLTLQECVKDAVLYLPRGKRQVLRQARRHCQINVSLVTRDNFFPLKLVCRGDDDRVGTCLEPCIEETPTSTSVGHLAAVPHV